MASNSNLISGFTPSETEIIHQHLTKLLPHLVPDKFILVGGLVIRHHLSKAGIDYQLHSFNDIDLIIEDESAIKTSINQDFLIAHRHPANHPWFFIVLIDPELKVKVHCFDYEMKPENTETVNFNEHIVEIVSVEDQLVKLAYDTQRISANQPVEPKQFQEAKLLTKIADMELADQIWRRHQFTKYPPSLMEAIKRSKQIAAQHPEWLQEKPAPSERKPYKCPDCVSSEKFPVTNMDQVYKIMGYGTP